MYFKYKGYYIHTSLDKNYLFTQRYTNPGAGRTYTKTLKEATETIDGWSGE